ncbi:MAG TPA: Sec-independent protein translocase subunit TatA [Frankiaceae bacterium]|jgi:sec-independent protein translocase protein TatA|nr:Sec-independent protein translocase subunit TatA [Frankiaceae bacterium]
MGELRPWHIIVLVVVVFVLFGYKKLPDATRSLGRSLRILKTEVKSLHDDEPEAAEQQAVAPRAVEAPRAAVPEASAPTVPPVPAGTPTTPTSDADHR